MKIWLLLAGYVLTALALGGAGLAAFLIHGGIYPLEGSGSPGHAGMIVAGIILGFMALAAALLGLLALCKAQRPRTVGPPPPPKT